MEDVCAICLEAVDAQSASMPGCHHKFHVKCIINAVQYDTRCPVCRHVGEGVIHREHEVIATETFVTPSSEMLRSSINNWRRYLDRRRRVFRQRTELSNKMQRLKDLRTNMRSTLQELQKSYEAKCKLIWSSDEDVTRCRKMLNRLRRRELRLARNLAVELEALIGPEPD